MTDSDHLRATIERLMRSGTTENPALNRLLDDYTRYHAVFVVVGGGFALGYLALSVVLMRRWRHGTVERRAGLGFGLVSGAVGLTLGVIVAANVSNVMQPRRGFTGAITMIKGAPSGTRADRLHQAFAGWLQSGSARMPSIIQRAVDDRLAWQRPKAIVCTLLLGGIAMLGPRLWRRLDGNPGVRLLAAGASAAVGLLLTLMVIGNTQGSAAPLSLTLLFG